MARIPNTRTCRIFGCHAKPTDNGYCTDHGGVKRMRSSAGAQRDADIYSTARWQRLRLDLLSRQPLCVACLCDMRLVIPATVIDHIVSAGQLIAHGYSPFDPSLCQPLCAGHHSGLKQSGERKGRFFWWTPEGRKVIESNEVAEWLRSNASVSGGGFRLL